LNFSKKVRGDQQMILLFGAPADSVMAYVCHRLLAQDSDFLLLDARHYPHQFDLTWSIENGVIDGSLRYGTQEVALSDVCSVYVRQMGTFDRSRQPSLRAEEHRPADHESQCFLLAFADTLPALVVNRPAAVSSNASKPYQQQIIARYGFKVPRTLVTTVPHEVHPFYEECNGRVIYKSVSYQRSIVRRMTPDDLQRLEQVRSCPTQFQEYIAGVDIRVHTVGRRVFATEIMTNATDYRYAGREGATRVMRGVEIPADVAERCLRLADGLGMVMSGIDLRRSPEGEYYCFEVNPSPAFTFYQNCTGQRIGDALKQLSKSNAVF
jgi:glutathione synthase/RimK-type ligase-like ATP-grasp enzyme